MDITIRSFWVSNRTTGKTYYAKKVKRIIPFNQLEIMRTDMTKRMNKRFNQDCCIYVFYTEKGFKLR